MTDQELRAELAEALMAEQGCEKGLVWRVPRGKSFAGPDYPNTDDDKRAAGWVFEDTGHCAVHDECQHDDKLRGEWVDGVCTVAARIADALLPVVRAHLAEAVRDEFHEYADALKGNESAVLWHQIDFVNDVREWADTNPWREGDDPAPPVARYRIREDGSTEKVIQREIARIALGLLESAKDWVCHPPEDDEDDEGQP